MSFDFKKDPFENFLIYYKEAQLRGVPEANAMTLATVNKENQPSVRIVYFKEFFEKDQNRGFCFYTNYTGRKGVDLDTNPKAAVNFFWPHMDQQVRVEGIVEKVPREVSEKYFASRARLSQIGAWASHQSETLENYETLLKRTQEIEDKYKGQKIPCPPHWGGYCLFPTEIEFWFGKTGRLHERYVYQRNQNNWNRLLKSP
ncbi:MAG: pyridoxamine 5'-phosphate oxidase [Pseudobdellovibrio sp.]